MDGGRKKFREELGGIQKERGKLEEEWLRMKEKVVGTLQRGEEKRKERGRRGKG